MNWVDYLLLALVAVSGIRGLRLGAASQVLSFGGFCLGLFLGALVARPWSGRRRAAPQPDRHGCRFRGRLYLRRRRPDHRGPLLRCPQTGAPGDCRLGGRGGRGRGRHPGGGLAGGQFPGQQPLHHSSTAPWTGPTSCGPWTGSCPRCPPSSPGSSRSWTRPAFPSCSPGCRPRRPPRVAAHQPGRPGRRAQSRAVDGADRGGRLWGHPGGIGLRGGPGLVVTNAHVVAGVARPVVLDGVGHHPATAVLFDPRLDLSVLRVPGLADPALPIDTTTVDRGTSGVVLGYPEGGPFDYRPAAVAAYFPATGLDIYGKTQTLRQVYQIDAVVQPGNSGAPRSPRATPRRGIPDGTVIGVVFARSTINPDVGLRAGHGRRPGRREPGRPSAGRSGHRRLHLRLRPAPRAGDPPTAAPGLRMRPWRSPSRTTGSSATRTRRPWSVARFHRLVVPAPVRLRLLFRPAPR